MEASPHREREGLITTHALTPDGSANGDDAGEGGGTSLSPYVLRKTGAQLTTPGPRTTPAAPQKLAIIAQKREGSTIITPPTPHLQRSSTDGDDADEGGAHPLTTRIAEDGDVADTPHSMTFSAPAFMQTAKGNFASLTVFFSENT